MSARASYQKLPNIKLGHGPKIVRSKVSGIGVVDPSTSPKRQVLRLPFAEHTIRGIALQNPDLSALTIACRLASGNRVTGFYADSTCGMSRRSVEFIGLE